MNEILFRRKSGKSGWFTMVPSRTTLAALTATLLACALLAGCTAQAQTGTAAIFVKDAASDDFTNLHVTFGEVAIHRESDDDDDHDDDDDRDDDDEDEAEDDEAEDDEDRTATSSSSSSGSAAGNGSVSISIREDDDSDDDGGWLVLSGDTSTVDLMAFTGSAAAFLAGADVPPGSYDKIKLDVLSARGTLHNGSKVPVEVPSGKLHIKAEFDVASGEETALTLDFDLEHSLVKTGDGRYLLKPVIHMQGEHHDRPDHDERERRERERDDHDDEDDGDDDDD